MLLTNGYRFYEKKIYLYPIQPLPTTLNAKNKKGFDGRVFCFYFFIIAT